jgi:hypothetical protein
MALTVMTRNRIAYPYKDIVFQQVLLGSNALESGRRLFTGSNGRVRLAYRNEKRE